MLSKTVEDNLFVQLGQIVIIGLRAQTDCSTNFQLLSRQPLLSVVL